MGDVHQLGDNGKTRLLPGDLQKIEALSAQPLEGVGGGAGLERAAPKHGGAAGLHGLGDGHHLLLALHGAGTRHNCQRAAADLGVPDLDHGVLRVKFAVCVFIRLLHPLDVIHNVKRGDQVDVQLGGVAHQSQNGVGLADAGVDGNALFLEPADEAFQLFAVGIALENDDHDGFLLKLVQKRPAAGWLRVVMYGYF
ncbi:hypothetical protein SDC9_129972 [bioreactor metagenome]|uniref:Uncharacterized protein n=1 Tax=bioreactor metagenome TaxID=1076179 RepID=A0A645D090_9ZZZZ